MNKHKLKAIGLTRHQGRILCALRAGFVLTTEHGMTGNPRLRKSSEMIAVQSPTISHLENRRLIKRRRPVTVKKQRWDLTWLGFNFAEQLEEK